MLNDLTAHIANTSGLGAPASKKALGIVLNAAERQDSPFAAAMFKAIPATRKLSTRTGKDAGAGKATLAGLHGAEWTRRQLNALVEEACGLLEPYGARASLLLDAARFVAIRDR